MGKTNILFWGTPDYSVETLETLFNKENINVVAVITKEDKKQGRGQKILSSPVKNFCNKFNIPCFQPKSLRKELSSFFNFLKNFPPIDLSVVIAYGQILPEEALNFPKYGSINLHASILPHLRGAAPIQRAIMEGSLTTGVSLMKMDAGLDTGNVFKKEFTNIDDTTTFLKLHNTLSSLSAKIIYENIDDIISGTLIAKPQEDKDITYAKKIEKEEAKINWDNPTKTIIRLINAMDPVLGAYSFWDDKRIKFFSPKMITESFLNFKKQPNGTVVMIDKESICIKCEDAILKIKEIQLEGKKRLLIKDFLTGHKIDLNTIFKSF